MYANPERDQYIPVDYLHVRAGRAFRVARAAAGVLTWPIVWPLAMLSRLSMFLFQTCSEFFSLFPYVFGIIVRYEFYRFALRKCGRNVFFGFGTVLNYRDIDIGDDVLIGRYNVIHHCDFGRYVMTAEHCIFLSGSRQHSAGRLDVPIALQGGQLKRIAVADGAWIGAGCVVMDNVGEGSIVGAGSVISKPVPPYSIAVGNPPQVKPRRPTALEGATAAQATDPAGGAPD